MQFKVSVIKLQALKTVDALEVAQNKRDRANLKTELDKHIVIILPVVGGTL